MGKAGNISKHHKTPEPIQCPYTYHNFPLNLFIDQVCDGNIDKDIFRQFIDETKSSEQAYIQKLVTDINILDTKFTLMNACVTYLDILQNDLSKERDPEVMAVIKLHIAVNDEMPLRIIYAKAKRFLTDIENKKSEFDRVANAKQGIKDWRVYFTHLVVNVQSYVKYQISKKETTVAEFAAMINDMRAYIDNLKKREHGR